METTSNKASYEFLAEPCRNFNILGRTTVIDPKDNREKVVLSNFAAGALGNVVLVDPETGEGESIPLPSDNGAWAVINYKNEKLIFGTCVNDAFVHVLDLKTRTWAESLHDGKELYFWKFALGSDGMVYGGTYPGCSLLRYDPERHVLEHMGRASQNPKNLYSRPVFGDIPGYIIVCGGYEEPFMTAFHIETKQFKEFGVKGKIGDIQEITEQYICVKVETEYYFYDTKTFELVENPTLPDDWSTPSVSSALTLQNGKTFAVRGQKYFILDKPDDKPEYIRIPTEPPATRIHTITSDPHGNIWGCSEFGQTIFRYDPNEGTYWNSMDVCDRGGEVYGMQFVGERLFMSSYVGGDHIVYDPAKPWDQANNVNPKTLEPVGPALIRPEGRSVLGPDGGIWTGWGAKYGTYGGGLSRIDPETLEVDSWYDPIPERSIAGVAADNRYIYFTTHGGGSGLKYRNIECHFAVFSPEGKRLFVQEFDKKTRLGTVLAIAGRVLVRTGTKIRIFDPTYFAFTGSLELHEECTWMTADGESTAVLFGTEHMFKYDLKARKLERIMKLPGRVATATQTPNGDLYFTHGTGLYKVNKI